MNVIGIDVGGTFTDVAARAGDGTLLTFKVPSTPPDFDQGVLTAVAAVGEQPDPRWSLSETERLCHGTTVAINTILQRRGARLGLLLTSGFEDVLVVGDGHRGDVYDLAMEPQEPIFLADRSRCRPVLERTGAQGEVVSPLEGDALLAEVRDLIESQGVEAIAVCLLHAFVNPTHELQVRDLIAAAHPGLSVVLSHEVLPRAGEYHRLVATGMEAYVRDEVSGYLGGLLDALADIGLRVPLTIMQSSGGVADAQCVAERPVRSLLSGLAAGVRGAAKVARRAEIAHCLTLDMGGTSADVAVILDGRPEIGMDNQVGGFPVRVPMVDVHTIGAGGSSIAWLQEGVLRVGPRSAGASPGPACYRRGGTLPTVTDASLVLGYLDPVEFAGDLFPDVDAAAAALRTIGEPLGLSVEEAALGVFRVVNANMADALRLVTVIRGHDPQDFTLMAFGGAGPVHAAALLAELQVRQVLVPPTPGVLCALGLLDAPYEQDAMATIEIRPDRDAHTDLAKVFIELKERCDEAMRPRTGGRHETRFELGVRYVGQTHELSIDLGSGLGDDDVVAAVAAFHEAHRERYTYSRPGAPVEFSSARVVGAWYEPGPDDTALPWPDASGPLAARSTRSCLFDGHSERIPTPVHDRRDLPRGAVIDGPAIIQQSDTTTVVPPGHRATVDGLANLLIEVTR